VGVIPIWRVLIVGMLALGCASAGPLTASPAATGQSTATPGGTPTAQATDSPSVDPTASPSAEPSEASASTEPWEWDIEPDATEQPPGGFVLEPAEGTPDGDASTGEFGSEDEQTTPAPDHDLPELDPCALIEDVPWPSSMGDSGFITPLEDGEACGLISRDDQVRVAFAVFDMAGDAGWLQGVDVSRAESIDYGDEAIWLAGWPIAQSSTLVVTLGPRQLVIEVSARTSDVGEAMLDTALHFAREIGAKLP
jgi:hypothetical protein